MSERSSKPLVVVVVGLGAGKYQILVKLDARSRVEVMIALLVPKIT